MHKAIARPALAFKFLALAAMVICAGCGVSQYPQYPQRILFTHAKDEGATGNGSTDDTAALLAGAKIAAAAGGTFQIPAGTYYVASNLTFPSNVRVRFDPGAVLKPKRGATITLSLVDAMAAQQCFDVSLGGVIAILAEPTISVQWFGAKGDGTTDDTTAVQAALNTVSGHANTVSATILVPPAPSYYKITSTLSLTGRADGTLGFRLVGAGAGIVYGSRLKWAGAPGGVLFNAFGWRNSQVQGITFDGGNQAATTFWLRTDQPNGGSGTSGVKFVDCLFVNTAGANSNLFRVGEKMPGQQQVDTVVWDNCQFIGAGATTTYSAMEISEGGNVKNFRFINDAFSYVMRSVHATVSGYYLFDTCTFSGFGFWGLDLYDGSGQVHVINPSTENSHAQSGAAFVNGNSFTTVTIDSGYIINDVNASALPGTATVANGSRAVRFSTAQNLPFGGVVAFSSQPGVYYSLSADVINSTSATLSTNYSGTASSSATTTPNPLHVMFNGSGIEVSGALIDGTAHNDSKTGNIAAFRGIPDIAAGNNHGPIVSRNNLFLGAQTPQITVYDGSNNLCLDFVRGEANNARALQITSEGDRCGTGSTGYVLMKSVRADAQENARTPVTGHDQTSGVKIVYRGEPRLQTTCYEIDGAKIGGGAVTLGRIQARQQVRRVIAEVTTAFDPGTKLSVGVTQSPGNEYLLQAASDTIATYGLVPGDLGTHLSSSANFAQGGDFVAWGGSQPSLYAVFNRSSLTKGVVRIYVTTEMLSP